MAIGSEGDRQSGGAGAGDEMCSRGPGCAAMILHSTRRSETRHRGFSGLAPLALAHVSPVEQGSAVEVRELLRAWAGFRKICSDRDQTQYS